MRASIRICLAIALVAVFAIAGGGSASGSPSAADHEGNLTGVACLSANDCWAIGLSKKRNGATATEALHWNGQSWNLAKTPDPAGLGRGGRENLLESVTCTSHQNCWAAGWYAGLHTSAKNLMLHWNGRAWKSVGVPHPGGHGQDALSGITCTSQRSCFAVGSYSPMGMVISNEVLRWNGRRWKTLRTPDPGRTKGFQGADTLIGVSCMSSTRCLALGSYRVRRSGTLNQVLRWNGRSWGYVPTPDASGAGNASENFLNSAACRTDGHCFAVGYYYQQSPVSWRNQVLQWEGSSWAETQVPDAAGSDQDKLAAVTCIGPVQCWAVGYVEERAYASVGDSNQVLRWEGRSWQEVGVPNPSGTGNGTGQALRGVACTSEDSCWAVGGYYDLTSGTDRTESLHWDGSSWVKVPS